MSDPLDETAATYASEGPTGVFGPAANGLHQLLSPFAVPSWEPRFAIDHLSVEAGVLAAALEFYLKVRLWRITGEERFVIYDCGPSRRLLFFEGSHFAGRTKPWEIELAGASVSAASERIATWLTQEAEYPPSPWFEGSENRGFQLFDVPFQAPPRSCYGGLIVEPKWFEIHK
ncbi:MAG: hypothetical protein ABL994_02160 [Verrucomicrobiales bacterium]